MSLSAASWRTLPKLGVVVPARNEERYLGDCLAALDVAAGAARLPLDILVVLDSCTDGTAAAVRDADAMVSSRIHVVHIDARRVGTARRVGVATLLEVLGGDGGWLATTDADSRVPPDWFTGQLGYRAAGADVVVGTVQVADWQGRAQLRPVWENAYVRDHQGQHADGHRHVHGANLSFSANSYLRAGGFADVASDEDVLLVNAFRSAGESIVWASDLPVATSVRRIGRAPHGFAAHLDRLAHLADTGRVLVPVPVPVPVRTAVQVPVPVRAPSLGSSG